MELEILETKAKISALTIRLANLEARRYKYVVHLQRDAIDDPFSAGIQNPPLEPTSRTPPTVRKTRKRNHTTL